VVLQTCEQTWRNETTLDIKALMILYRGLED